MEYNAEFSRSRQLYIQINFTGNLAEEYVTTRKEHKNTRFYYVVWSAGVSTLKRTVEKLVEREVNKTTL